MKRNCKDIYCPHCKMRYFGVIPLYDRDYICIKCFKDYVIDTKGKVYK